MLILSQNLDFEVICRGLFVFNGLRLEMDVRFVDIIGGAVNHHFCFITCDFQLFSLYVWETRWVLYIELKKLDVFLTHRLCGVLALLFFYIF